MIIRNERLELELFLPDRPVVLCLDNPISKFSLRSLELALNDKNTEMIIDHQNVEKFKFINIDNISTKDVNKIIVATISSIIVNNSTIYNNLNEMEKVMFSTKFQQGLNEINECLGMKNFVVPKLIDVDDILSLIVDTTTLELAISAFIKCLSLLYPDTHFLVVTDKYINMLVVDCNYKNVQFIHHVTSELDIDVILRYGLFVPGSGIVKECEIPENEIGLIRYIFNDVVIKNFHFQNEKIKEIIKLKYKIDPNLIVNVSRETFKNKHF